MVANTRMMGAGSGARQAPSAPATERPSAREIGEEANREEDSHGEHTLTRTQRLDTIYTDGSQSRKPAVLLVDPPALNPAIRANIWSLVCGVAAPNAPISIVLAGLNSNAKLVKLLDFTTLPPEPHVFLKLYSNALKEIKEEYPLPFSEYIKMLGHYICDSRDNHTEEGSLRKISGPVNAAILVCENSNLDPGISQAVYDASAGASMQAFYITPADSNEASMLEDSMKSGFGKDYFHHEAPLMVFEEIAKHLIDAP